MTDDHKEALAQYKLKQQGYHQKKALAQAKELADDFKGRSNHVSEAKRIFSDEAKQRNEKGHKDSEKTHPTFLRPEQIAKGAKYDIEQVFKTTLGGYLRTATQQDLIAFTKNIELLSDQYVKGITAKKVINLSRPIDIERCNRQIFAVNAISLIKGVVQFQTSASKLYNETHHFVNVEFTRYNSTVLSPKGITKQDLKREVILGGLRFECDCGRHKYVYRYMATIGGYNYGRKEEGFPKEKNPNLNGLACKHVLRVMDYILSPLFLEFMARNFKKERNTQYGSRIKPTKTQAIKDLEANAKRQGQKRYNQITQNQKAQDRELQARVARHAKRLQAERIKSIMKSEKNITKGQAEKRIKQDAKLQLNSLLNQKLITPDAYNVILASLNK